MYCNQCGNAIEDHFRFCSRCGTSTENTPRSESGNAHGLSRPYEGTKIAGVCAGVARYLDLDVTLVRIVWVLLVIFPPVPGILAYIICWIVMPKDPRPLPAQVSPVAGSPIQSA
jgi:phage shock protein C